MSDDLDRKRLEGEMRHYKAQLAGKIGWLRRLWGYRYYNGHYPYSEHDAARVGREMGHIGLKYLALQARLEG